MKSFKDNSGRTWNLSVDVSAIKRVRSLIDVDLLSIADGKGKVLEQLVDDPIVLCDVIYCLCKPEADAKDVTDEDFGRAMGGDALGDATNALLEDLVNFFPKPKRDLLDKALRKLRSLQEMAQDIASKKLDSPELEAEMKALLKFGDSSGSLPE